MVTRDQLARLQKLADELQSLIREMQRDLGMDDGHRPDPEVTFHKEPPPPIL